MSIKEIQTKLRNVIELEANQSTQILRLIEKLKFFVEAGTRVLDVSSNEYYSTGFMMVGQDIIEELEASLGKDVIHDELIELKEDLIKFRSGVED